MKIGGVEVTKCEEVLVLPRTKGPDIVFHAVAVTDMDEFEALCPVPEIPKRIVRGGTEENPDSPGYKDQLKNWSQRRFDYILLKSLEPSNIEWSKVNLDKPSTWKLWQDEFKAAGISENECKRVINLVLQANSLDERKLQEAREAFLRGQGADLGTSSGQNTEPVNTSSGQLASDSESDHQE